MNQMWAGISDLAFEAALAAYVVALVCYAIELASRRAVNPAEAVAAGRDAGSGTTMVRTGPIDPGAIGRVDRTVVAPWGVRRGRRRQNGRQRRTTVDATGSRAGRRRTPKPSASRHCCCRCRCRCSDPFFTLVTSSPAVFGRIPDNPGSEELEKETASAEQISDPARSSA